jgi:hypothetical protein
MVWFGARLLGKLAWQTSAGLSGHFEVLILNSPIKISTVYIFLGVQEPIITEQISIFESIAFLNSMPTIYVRVAWRTEWILIASSIPISGKSCVFYCSAIRALE